MFNGLKSLTFSDWFHLGLGKMLPLPRLSFENDLQLPSSVALPAALQPLTFYEHFDQSLENVALQRRVLGAPPRAFA